MTSKTRWVWGELYLTGA
jgi:hypothetical protein